MAATTPPVRPEDGAVHVVRPGYDPLPVHSHHHGVCWKAVLAGALAAAALSLILLMLGLGFGFSAVSPWAHDGADADTLSHGAIAWISLMSLLSSGLGGYMAGRLRRPDPTAGVDEEHFRDTANGFLSWAVATLLTAALLSSVIGSIAGGAAKVGAAAVGGAATTAAGAATAMAGRDADGQGSNASMGYYVDSLFRSGTTPAATGTAPASGAMTPDFIPAPTTPAPTAQAPMAPPAGGNGEAVRIMANAVGDGTLSPTDRQYLAQQVAQRAGVTQAEAERRVNDTFARLQNAKREAEVKARQAAETARKVARNTAFWTFFSLLLGAFAASAAALLGSRHVIRHPATTRP